jgi:hypothetical protein
MIFSYCYTLREMEINVLQWGGCVYFNIGRYIDFLDWMVPTIKKMWLHGCTVCEKYIA